MTPAFPLADVKIEGIFGKGRKKKKSLSLRPKAMNLGLMAGGNGKMPTQKKQSRNLETFNRKELDEEEERRDYACQQFLHLSDAQFVELRDEDEFGI